MLDFAEKSPSARRPCGRSYLAILNLPAMADLKETEFWVYRKKDQSLVGTLDVTELQDEFMDVGIAVCSGKLTHAQTPEIDRNFMGWYELKRPGREEYFGDFETLEEVCEAVRNHPEGVCYLRETPELGVVE